MLTFPQEEEVSHVEGSETDLVCPQLVLETRDIGAFRLHPDQVFPYTGYIINGLDAVHLVPDCGSRRDYSHWSIRRDQERYI